MLKYFVTITFLFCSSLLCAEVVPALKETEKLAIKLHFGTGMILFPDLYVPHTNTDPFVPHLRADGNIREADSLKHLGIAIECGLTMHKQLPHYLLAYQLGYRRAGSLGVGGRYADSSYANVFTGVKSFYYLHPRFLPGVGLAMQRVAFSNLSRAHTVMSLLPTAEIRLPLAAELTVSGAIGYALWNRSGYANNVQFIGKRLAGAKAKVWSAKLSAEKKINSSTSFILSANHERIALHLDDINSYRLLGLTLIAPQPTPRDVPMHTSTLSLSLQRNF